MLKIFVLLHLSVIVFAAPKLTGNTIQNLKWYCSTICEGCGGQSMFNFEEPACICTIDDSVSDDDVAIIRKTAATVGMTMSLQNRNNIRKRETEEATTKFSLAKLNLPPLRFKLRSRFLKNNGSDGEPLLGQLNPFHTKDIMHNGLGPFAGQNLLPPPAAHPSGNVQSAVTQALLRNVKARVDALIEKTEKFPYDHHRAAHEVEHISNTLKQITHLNTNFRAAGATTPKFWGNLAHLMPGRRGLVGQAVPDEVTTQMITTTVVGGEARAVSEVSEAIEVSEVDESDADKRKVHDVKKMAEVEPSSFDNDHVITQPKEYMDEEEDS